MKVCQLLVHTVSPFVPSLKDNASFLNNEVYITEMFK